MFRYPTLAESSDSFTFLARLVANPGNWNAQTGGLHLYTVQGYLQSQFLGEPEEAARVMHVENAEAELKAVHPEGLQRAFEAMAARGRGDAVQLAIGQGLLLKVVGRLVAKFIESGLAEDVIRKLLGEMLNPALPR